MKVQLDGQQVRFRIDEAELARLQVGDAIENRTSVAGACSWTQRVQLSASASASIRMMADALLLEIPAAQLNELVTRLPCRDGLQWRLPVSDEWLIEVRFDIDVRDSTRNRVRPRQRK